MCMAVHIHKWAGLSSPLASNGRGYHKKIPTLLGCPFFLALFPHILGVPLFMGFSRSDDLWDSPKTPIHIPELTDREETPSFWMLFKSWGIPWCHSFSVCPLYLCYYLFLFDLLETKCSGGIKTAIQKTALLVKMLSLGICLEPQPHR